MTVGMFVIYAYGNQSKSKDGNEIEEKKTEKNKVIIIIWMRAVHWCVFPVFIVPYAVSPVQCVQIKYRKMDIA